MNKKEMRKAVRESLKGLPEGYRAGAGRKIAAELMELPEFKKAGTVFIYVSTDSEPDTAPVIDEALKTGKRVCVPKCRDAHHMDAIEIRSRDELKPGAYGIPEPAGDGSGSLTVMAAKDIELAVIPCLAAGRDGSRLGHGAGYYDIFLEEKHIYKICLCFGRLLRDDIEMDENDIRMDRVISEY